MSVASDAHGLPLQVFNKSAYVAIQVLKVKGTGRLRFTREPYTNWSFAFNEVSTLHSNQPASEQL